MGRNELVFGDEMFIDAHLHTDIYESQGETLDQALKLIGENGILVLSNSMDLDSYEATLRIAKRSDFVLPCFGIHPFAALEYVDKLDSLTDCLNQALMFGEIGLDHFYTQDSTQYLAQQKIFELFLETAEKQDKIVILHLVGAEKKGLETIQSFSLKKVIAHGIVHGYGGSWKTLRKMSDLGIHFSMKKLRKMFDLGINFSLGGSAIMDNFKPAIPINYWNAVQQIVKEVPNDLLLTETGGPCQTDLDAPPDSSIPTFIKDVIAKIAEIRKTSVEELVCLVTANFLNLIESDNRLASFVSLIRKHSIVD
ncbi:MAG: TatD family hydrolase [Candidatus Bathyarchaeota archaeon]|nr:TatD family hydrolase [Candidatus Bathyarchaeota archaeon]